MMPTELRLFMRVGGTLLLGGCLVVPLTASGAEPKTFQSDFGGVGLLQTPTARMAPVGEFSFTYNEIEPYTRYAVSVQPFEWMEFGFRYTSITNRDFEASGGELDFLDKGVDVKLSLIDESRYVPEVALGFRDFGGTGLFGSEYVVANKRWYDFDFSLGLGWGYFAAPGGVSNPLTAFGERFEERQGRDEDDQGGTFGLNQLFTGPASFFGGIQYHTPWEPLTLQLEYDGNDYRNEPLNNPQEQDSPINLGARYKVNDNLVFSAGWERGNTAMLGLTLSANLAELSQPKNDPAPVPAGPAPESTTKDWDNVSQLLASNAGISASRIVRRGNTLVIEGEATKYRSRPETELRANRILHNAVDDDIEQFAYRWKRAGFYLREDILPRQPLPSTPFIATAENEFVEQDYRHDVYAQGQNSADVARDEGELLYEDPERAFSYGLSPGLNQNYGGPDGYLYQVFARLNTTWRTDSHGFLSSTLAYTLFDNFDEYDYIADSDLPRVRTFIGNYLQETDLGLYNLQYTRTARLAENWFAMGYGGLLEMMYGGVGGEVLYRPFNSPLAVGLDVNWVQQREFDGRFGFRDYSTVTGNLSTYLDTGIKDVLAKISVGRYLAKDVGMTLDFSRRFDSGIRLGAYATFTDAGDAYGEGSFDKGIYLTVPFDAFFTNSSRQHATVAWDPLTRDGGARLDRRYTLYGLTSDRDMGHYWLDYENDQ